VKCPVCKEGEIVEKKARRGNFFYGCSTYPKCEFTSAYKPVAETCPDCGSPYLLEKNLKSGTFLVCPNNKRTEPEEPKRRTKKGKTKEVELPAMKCDYSRQIATPEAVA
jgi:DNA topoisomerase-1